MTESVRVTYHPSYAAAFEQAYGSELDLLEQCKKLTGIEKAAL